MTLAATHADQIRQVRRLRRHENGYTIDDEFRVGFHDDPSLTIGQRLRIAGWARALSPEDLTDVQRELLDRPRSEPAPPRKRSPGWSGTKEARTGRP